MANQREDSKRNWSSNGRIEEINSGSLQRIADATEVMAQNYVQLQNDRDMYKRWWQERPESELPQYLALNKRVFRVTRIEVSNNSIWLDGCEHTLKYILRVALPATEAEYLTYKKQTDAR